MRHWEAADVGVGDHAVKYLRNKISRKTSVVNHAMTVPDYVLKDLCLVNDGQATRGFRYSRDPANPKLVYDLQQCCGLYCYPKIEREVEDNMSYARVLTKNAYYEDLWKSISSVAVDVLDEYSHINFCAILLCHTGASFLLTDVERYGFVVLIICCDLAMLALALDRASHAWRDMVIREEGGDVDAGDLVIGSYDCAFKEHPQSDGFAWVPASFRRGPLGAIVSIVRLAWRALSWVMRRRAPRGRSEKEGFQRLAWYSEWQLFLQMWLMEFFGVRKRVAESFVQVHPFHATMPWCAFRKDSARANLLCFEDKSMFRYEDCAGLEWSIPLECIIKLTLFVVKARLALGLKSTIPKPLLFFFVGPTFFSLYIRVSKWRTLKKDRHAFKTYLRNAMAENPNDPSITRLWEKYFGKDRLTARIKLGYRGLKRTVNRIAGRREPSHTGYTRV